MLNNQTQGSSSLSSGGFSIPLIGSFGGGGGSSSSSSTTSLVGLSTQASANQFLSIAQQASQYTDVQRSITVSSYEDNETVSTTQRSSSTPTSATQ